MEGLGIPSFGQATGAPGVRKQRSQRFTVPSHQPGRTRSIDQPSAGDYDSSPPPPPVPSLPYMAPPPPVQSQSLIPPPLHHHHHRPYSATTPESYGAGTSPPVDPTSQLSLEFLASPTGMSPYPGPAFTAQAQAQPQAGGGALPAGNAPSPLSAGGPAGSSASGMPTTTESGPDEIIETAIVIKSIPFACPKEHLLAVMASLSLPPPFAFNYHFAPEDPTSFRGLAFANYRSPAEAAVVRAAMDGLEIMGRKLRAEFKKQLRPGEKEMIERTKAIKRMRSAQMLAAGGSSGADRDRGGVNGGWNSSRREATDGGARTFGQREFVPAAGIPPPVPAIPPYFQQQHQHAQQSGPSPQHYLGPQQQPLHVGAPMPFSYPYQRPPPALGPSHYEYPNGNAVHQHHHHQHQHHGSISASSSQDPPLSSAPTIHSFGVGETSNPQLGQPGEPNRGTTTSSSEVSDVGTSVSQRVPTRRSSDGEASAAGSSQIGAGREELDMNDPTTLELYSRVLLFSSDSLRDELAFSRSLSTPQRRTVHLIAQKLGLEHRSVGSSERRCVVVYKRGCAPPLEAGIDVDGRQRVPQTEPPRRSLRGSVSSVVLRHTASRDALFSSPSPTSRAPFSASHDQLLASELAPNHQQQQQQSFQPRHQHSGSSSGGSSAFLSPIGSDRPNSNSMGHLRGKKSMPDMRFVTQSHHYGQAGSASMAMLPSLSGSGSSGLQYGDEARAAAGPGSRSPSPYAYSTPASSPLALLPGGGAQGLQGQLQQQQQNPYATLPTSASLGADMSGYLASTAPDGGYQQQGQQALPRPEQQGYGASGVVDHEIRKSFSTMRLSDDRPASLSSIGWGVDPTHHLGTHAEEAWPIDATKTIGPRQFRRHVAIPTPNDWSSSSPSSPTKQQASSIRPSVQSLFSAEPNELAPGSRPIFDGEHHDAAHGAAGQPLHGLRSAVSVGGGLGSGFGGIGGSPGGLEWRRRE